MYTVLVVDDDRHQRLLYHEELVHEGYDVVEAASAKEAIARVQDGGIDLVVLDIAMPGMNGVEALTRILDIDNKMPVVLNTAYSGYKDDFMTWAAQAYVVKSSDLSVLKRQIREALKTRGTEPAEPPNTGE
jgi:CheY-like chemotaxis protein